MKNKQLFRVLFVAVMLISLIACGSTPNQPKSPSEQLELALGSVRRVKIHFNAQTTFEGQVKELLSGEAQFESKGDDSKPLAYINTNQTEIFLSEDRAAVRHNLTDWQELQFTNTYLDTLIKITGLSPEKILPETLFSATSLRLTSDNLNNSWESFGTTEIDGQQVYFFQRENTDVGVWNGIFVAASARNLLVKKTLTELWIGVANNLPYRVRYTLYISNTQSNKEGTLEINLYPYDFNEPLNLPNKF